MITSPLTSSAGERRRQASFRSRGIAAAILLLLAACGGHRDSAQPANSDTLPPLATRLFSVAYDQISERYVQQVALSNLTGAGLGNLAKLDTKFEVRVNGRQMELREDGTPVALLDMPAREDDSRRWAQFTVAAIDASRQHSAALRATAPEQLYQTIFDGALTRLDAYSRYAGQEAARDNRASRDGFSGIGITIEMDPAGLVRVSSVFTGSPADRSGLKIDDRITHVDGDYVVGKEAREIVHRLRGPIGRSVDVTVKREQIAHPLQLLITRTLIVPPTVQYKRHGNVAYIKLSGFNHRTTDNLSAQIRAAMKDIGPDLEGLILDLRGNLGGLLDQAISVADLFLANGQIVSTRGRHHASAQSTDAAPGDLAERIPLVLLVNGASASASEIVAAALQDNSRAVVIGSTSFGKGSVQTVITLPNEGELALTWARFHAPSGYPLQDLGILPAVCTSGTSEDANGVVESIRAGRLTDATAMAKWRAADHSNMDGLKRLREICAPETRERDLDIEVARRLLTDRQLYARALSSVQVAAKAVKPLSPQ
jgi:carboxyl-terminal processing protease